MTDEKKVSTTDEKPNAAPKKEDEVLTDEELGEATGGQKPSKPFVREGGPIIFG